MFLSNRPAWLVSLALAACHGNLPTDNKPDDDVTDDDPVEDTDQVVEDTDPPPPCDLPEVEPNNSAATAMDLPLEVLACGTFSAPEDADYFAFVTTEEGWLAVDVSGYRLGSDARAVLSLSSASGVNVGISGWQEIPEVHFKMPVGVDTFSAFLRQPVESGAGGGESFFYELRASSQKPPVDWDVDETANETGPTAQVLDVSSAAGASVFGHIADLQDQDWYRVSVPEGRTALTLDVDAHEFGSAGDFALEITTDAGTAVASVTSGQLRSEPDPYYVLHSTEPRVLRVRVVDQGRLSGAAIWYVLRATLVEE